MCRPDRVGDRVVDVAYPRRRFAPGKPARQIPAPDKLRHRRRRPIPRLGDPTPRRKSKWFDCGGGRQFAQQRRRDRPEPQIPRIL